MDVSHGRARERQLLPVETAECSLKNIMCASREAHPPVVMLQDPKEAAVDAVTPPKWIPLRLQDVLLSEVVKKCSRSLGFPTRIRAPQFQYPVVLVISALV